MLEPHPYTILYCCCWAFVKNYYLCTFYRIPSSISNHCVLLFVCKYYIVQYILQERKKFFGELWQLLDILSCVLRWVIKIGGILRVRGLGVSWAEESIGGIPFIPILFVAPLQLVNVRVSNTTTSYSVTFITVLSDHYH